MITLAIEHCLLYQHNNRIEYQAFEENKWRMTSSFHAMTEARDEAARPGKV